LRYNFAADSFWVTVCKNGSPYAIRQLSVLSVCLSVLSCL